MQINAGRARAKVLALNTGDRPIQIGSHYHFFETNPALRFDREQARGMRLDIAAGTAVRFEPGQSREVRQIDLGDGQVGEIEVVVAAQADDHYGLLQHSERTVETRVQGTTRRTSESWSLTDI